jgi:hypothetical protein
VVKLALVLLCCALSFCVCCASLLGIDDAHVTVGEGGASDAAADASACLEVFLSLPWMPRTGGRDSANMQCNSEGQILCPGATYVAFLPDGGDILPPNGGTCTGSDGGAYDLSTGYWAGGPSCNYFTGGPDAGLGSVIKCPDMMFEINTECTDTRVHLLCQRLP